MSRPSIGGAALASLFASLLASLLVTGAARAERSIAEQASTESEVGRSVEQVLRAPLAISVVSRDEVTRAKPDAELADALELVPGVFVQSAGNFAQDSRVSIRGSGARAQFGIRDVRMRIDGVPATLPDGQAEVDSLDLAFVDRIDVVRGSVSSLYGGSSGGLISISTLAPTEEMHARLRSVFGSDGIRRSEGSLTGTLAGTGYMVGLAQTRSAGYRSHARGEQTTMLLKGQRELDDGSQLRVMLSSTWAPEAQDPGGLTRREVRLDRDSAAAAARSFDAGEKLDQQKLSLAWERPLGTGRSLGVQAYRIHRNFDSNLALARTVEFDRDVTGGALVYRDRRGPFHLVAGVDFDVQQDLRTNHLNSSGARGALQLDQAETVRALGPFAELELDLTDRLSTVAGLRYDRVTFEVEDRFVVGNNPDDSDSVHFRELSPRFALSYAAAQSLNLHASVSGGFGVPSTTELRPVTPGRGGFDSDREPERSLTLEVGAKGVLGDRLVYDVTLFDLRINDALVPFGVNGDTFFRNAGEVRRRGVELALSARLAAGLTARASYTYADYRYRDFDKQNGSVVTDLDGNREPNVPMHSAAAELRYESPGGMFAVLALRHFSDIEVNDENRVSAPTLMNPMPPNEGRHESKGATLVEARLGYRWTRGELSIEPFVSLRNLTGAHYDGTVRPNAAGDRFFEPGPERQIFAGAELRF